MVTIEYSGGDVSNYLVVGFDNVAPTHNGNYATLSGTWTGDAGFDMIFYVYTDAITTNELSIDTYYWRVRGKDTGTNLWGAWSSTRSFSVIPFSANSERSAKTAGKATTNSERSALTRGKLTSNSERSAKTTGIGHGISDRPAKTTGVDTANSERSAKVTGVIPPVRYWVGGSGDWTDTDHWAIESGGSGGFDAPTQDDDVFIDENSGFGSGGTITLDTYGHTKDFICDSGDTYTISGPSNRIYIKGNCELDPNMTLDVEFIGFGIYVAPE